MSESKKRNKNVDKEETSDVQKELSSLRVNIAEKALQIVHEVMPSKVILLNSIHEKHAAFNVPINEVKPKSFLTESAKKQNKGDAKHKKRKLTDKDEITENEASEEQQSLSNSVISDMLAVVKKEILELIEYINTVKIWIQLNIPRIEDGNNFGVSVQEEIVSELGRAEESGFAVLENITKYYVNRAKLVSKTIKYPQIQDYKESVIELDEKEYINLRMCSLDLRNNYAILHDIITKNLEKIKTPRSSHHTNLML